MLKNNLYQVSSINFLPQDQEGTGISKYSVSLRLESSHDIFKGHFPGNPVLPGVCQVEMVRELAEEILGSRLLLPQASQIKYLSLINPMINPLLWVSLKFSPMGQDEFDVSAEVTSGDLVFMKMKGRLKTV